MSELIDLVNIDGEIQRRAVSRDDADSYIGLYMQIVIAVVTNGLGHVLVHERSMTKSVNPGHIDHVCGGILAGEDPLTAAKREAKEEVGIEPENLKVVRRGVNIYGRYCYLLSGISEIEPPEMLDSSEVSWAKYMSVEDLRVKGKSGEFKFVDGFFEDIEIALTFSTSEE
jgi:8-oxo-dGTP pyrophosphatase MutT (NUDIX family)